MSGTSPLVASGEQRDGLKRLAISANRAEADRARAILLSLSGWKSAAIGEVFGVREDTVRDWRSTFMREGLAGIERHPAPGRSPVKAEAALAVANELFAAPVKIALTGPCRACRRKTSGAPGIASRIHDLRARRNHDLRLGPPPGGEEVAAVDESRRQGAMVDLGSGARAPGGAGVRLEEIGGMVAEEFLCVAALDQGHALRDEALQLDGADFGAVLFRLRLLLRVLIGVEPRRPDHSSARKTR
jgi:transposase-like protein